MNFEKTDVCHIPVELQGDYGLELTGEIVARYTYRPGYSATMIDPGMPANIEIESAILKVNDKTVAGVSIDMLDSDAIHEACLDHANCK